MRSLLSVLALGAIFCAFSAHAAERRPNILLCVADDWGWPHAGAYGAKVVKTPHFDRVAREGILFTHAFSAAPSCTPSRAAMLTGQYPHRLAEGGNLWSFLPKRFPVYPDLLEAAGYRVGITRKAWGPGDFRAGGYTRNPAGPQFKSFAEFLAQAPADQPFCFWLGSSEPHRPYDRGAGARAGMHPEEVTLPASWPDAPEIRNDVLDYLSEVQAFDSQVGEALALLEKSGRLANTLVVVTSDNGWPFPRAKANLYDAGTRQPLAVRWPERIAAGGKSESFINLMDLAPTFLEAAGLQVPPEMTSRSFLGIITSGPGGPAREEVFLERERHADVRAGHVGYPMRAIRTRDFLYIRNLRPERWPAGDPDHPRVFGDCDDGPTKQFILAHRELPAVAKAFELCFARRPAEELYDLAADPQQINNVAGQQQHAAVQKQLRGKLEQWMRETKDPRASNDDDPWDRYPYFAGTPKKTPATPAPQR